MGTSDSDDRARQSVVCDLVLGLAGERLDVLHTLDTETDGTDTVHGRGNTTLLHVSRDGETRVELAAALFTDNVCDDFGSVGLGCFFVAENNLSAAVLALVLGELLLQMLNVRGDHLEVDALFGCVDGNGTNRETGNGSDVA